MKMTEWSDRNQKLVLSCLCPCESAHVIPIDPQLSLEEGHLTFCPPTLPKIFMSVWIWLKQQMTGLSLWLFSLCLTCSDVINLRHLHVQGSLNIFKFNLSCKWLTEFYTFMFRWNRTGLRKDWRKLTDKMRYVLI